jgi:hypothetical protein
MGASEILHPVGILPEVRQTTSPTTGGSTPRAAVFVDDDSDLIFNREPPMPVGVPETLHPTSTRAPLPAKSGSASSRLRPDDEGFPSSGLNDTPGDMDALSPGVEALASSQWTRQGGTEVKTLNGLQSQVMMACVNV